MELASSSIENAGPFSAVRHWFKALLEKLRSMVIEIATEAKKLGQDDPRRIIHSAKVGLAICLVSLFYYFDPLYEGFGISAMWAVMTVVVVFEFSVGATLGRGLNRGVATFIAGGLGVGAHRLAGFSGETYEPMVLGLFVFLLAAVVTFMRFFPKMKARFDYGLLIFILTFCLICVSGYRDDEVLDIARTRLSTVLIGGATAVIICFCICPVWAGDDLHNLVAINMEKLGDFLEGFGAEYFKIQGHGESKEADKSFLQGHNDVLNSKGTEESLANFAKWEPRHGRFRYHHPWDQYLKIGALARQCACRIEALNGYLNSDIQASPKVRAGIEESCTKMSTECSHALKQLSLAIKTLTWPSSANSHIANSKIAATNLKYLLKTESWPDTDLLEIIPVATVASLLIDIVCCTEKIAESIHELASKPKLKKIDAAIKEQLQLIHQRTMQPCSSIERSHHAITINTPSQGPAE